MRDDRRRERRDGRSSLCGDVLFCFALLSGATVAAQQPTTAAPASTATTVEEITGLLLESKVRGGLIVHVGCGEGGRTAALRAADSFVVQGLEADSAKVAAARKHIRGTERYGSVSIVRWTDLARLPYAENMINLLLVEATGKLSEVEVLRVLAPKGIAYMREQNGQWRKVVKPWPEGMDEWSHWDHGADGNPVSLDVFVGPPRRTQWIDGPTWSKKHWGPRLSAIVTAGGQLFCVQDETPTSLFNIEANWVLIARDAFNGVVLWRRDLPDWTKGGWGPVVRRSDSPPRPFGGAFACPTDGRPGLILGLWGELSGGSGRRDAMDVMVADHDRLYVPLAVDAPLSAIDAATGKVICSYDQVAPVQEVLLTDGVLLIAGRDQVCAVRPDDRQSLWETAGSNLCASDGKVFLTSPRGRSVVCVDLVSGDQRWEVDFTKAMLATSGKPASEREAFTGPLLAGAGIVLAGTGDRKNAQTIAISATDGSALWRSGIGDRPFRRGGGPFLIDGLVWTLNPAQGRLTALDPQTSEPVKEIAAPAIRYAGHHARCYLARATCRYVIGKERGADFVDLESGEVTWNNWLRGPCHRGVLPANGLLYAGQHSCRCYTEAALHGFHALAPAGESKSYEDALCERGPAYGQTHNPQPETHNPLDWPTFRHDGTRSGATDAEFPANPTPRWTTRLGGKLSPPVVASGRVYVAAVDHHTVYSLDSDTGETLWQYTAGGRVDGPPTIHGRLALFGCRDGWVYCLRATDGAQVWRFRAAPEDRMVGAYGQLESAWPVPGSVLIKDDVAFCVAGRSSYLDGGLYVLALDPHTGRRLHQKRLFGPWPNAEIGASPETPNPGFTSEGALPDVLVSDSDHVYLRHLRFDTSLREAHDMRPNFYQSPELKGENRGGDHKYWDNLLEAPRHANFTDPNWFHRSFFQNFPGLRLYATTGLIDDDSWHRRMYWSYGQVVGQYLVFRGQCGYAVQVFATSPREGGSNAGDGYVVYAGRSAEREEGRKRFALRHDQSRWRIRVPFRPIAMVLAAEKLILAGPPDSPEPREALAAVQGRRGATMWVVNAADGEKLAQHRLKAPPRYDGMAVTSGRCYLTTAEGQVVCLGEQPNL